MTRLIEATVEAGYLKPDVPLQVPSGTRVRLWLEADDESRMSRAQALDELERLCKEVQIHSGGERLSREQLHERR